jgi:hypothetical protein
MVTPNTLADIRTKVRRLTARPSVAQIDDATIDGYVNTYYLQDMPESLRLLKLEDVYTFTTTPDVDVYAFPSNAYTTVKPPVYVAGQQVQWFNDNDMFYRQWPKLSYITQVATGNGGAGPYIGVIAQHPFLQSSNMVVTLDAPGMVQNILFTAADAFLGSIDVTDDGGGNILAPGAGTVNNITGAFNITFPAAIAAGVPIYAEVVPYVASKPRSVMFFQDQFTLRPVPDKAYIVEINTQRVPTELLLATDSPELDQLWQLLAFGAAQKILVDNGDFEIAEKMQPYFEQQMVLANRKTIRANSSVRSSTIFDGTSGNPYSNLYPYI